MRSGKAWGVTEVVITLPGAEIHRIVIEEGGYCSRHMHKHKWNAFYVEYGCLDVSVWKSDYDLTDITHLSKGQILKVAPGEYHQFRSEHGATVYEIYWTELSASDIVRDTCGGLETHTGTADGLPPHLRGCLPDREPKTAIGF